MSQPMISVSNLSKKYTLGERQPYYSLRDTIADLVKKPIKKLKGEEKLSKGEFWALKDVSFDINQGEVVGVIGRNGAGKSTLLKILSQITPPTNGEIRLNGRVASLLEVGTGFHPELTGRENIFLNGAILGMKRYEIKKRFDEIVEFAEIEKFLDSPVKHYSSGMYMRLAFAVAAHLEPEILLVDEVLAVGDTAFQKKCLGKMDEISKGSGRTILFVSHNMAAIESLCSKSIVISNGKVMFMGKTKDAIEDYQSNTKRVTETALSDRKDRKGSGVVRFVDVEITSDEHTSLESGKKLIITAKYKAKKDIKYLNNCRVSFLITDFMGNNLFVCSTEQYFKESLTLKPSGKIKCEIGSLPLTLGDYYVSLFFEENKIVSDWVSNAQMFSIQSGSFHLGVRQAPVGFEGKVVLVKHDWVTD